MPFTCSTCLDSLSAADSISSAPCGHVFHTNCISKWLTTGKSSCPQCRARCSEARLRRLFFTQGLDATIDIECDANSADLAANASAVAATDSRVDIDRLTVKLNAVEERLAASLANETAAGDVAARLRVKCNRLESEVQTMRDELAGVRTQMRYLNCERDEVERIRTDLAAAREKLATYSLIDELVSSSKANANRRLHEMGQYDEGARKWCVIVEALKHDMQSVSNEKARLEAEVRRHASIVASVKAKLWQSEQTVAQLREAETAARQLATNATASPNEPGDSEKENGAVVFMTSTPDGAADDIFCLADGVVEPPRKCRPAVATTPPSHQNHHQQRRHHDVDMTQPPPPLRRAITGALKRSTTNASAASRATYDGMGSSASSVANEVAISRPAYVRTRKPKGVGRLTLNDDGRVAGSVSSSQPTVAWPSRQKQKRPAGRVAEDTIFLLDTP